MELMIRVDGGEIMKLPIEFLVAETQRLDTDFYQCTRCR